MQPHEGLDVAEGEKLLAAHLLWAERVKYGVTDEEFETAAAAKIEFNVWLLNNAPALLAAAREAESAYEDGAKSVLYIRCMDHYTVPQYNRNEIRGAECAACEVERLREALEDIADNREGTSAHTALQAVYRKAEEALLFRDTPSPAQPSGVAEIPSGVIGGPGTLVVLPAQDQPEGVVYYPDRFGGADHPLAGLPHPPYAPFDDGSTPSAASEARGDE